MLSIHSSSSTEVDELLMFCVISDSFVNMSDMIPSDAMLMRCCRHLYSVALNFLLLYCRSVMKLKIDDDEVDSVIYLGKLVKENGRCEEERLRRICSKN